jgi:hypothetical protein
MLSEDELEKDMLEDLDYMYQVYRQMLNKGQTNITQLNTVIRALKAVHRYFRKDDSDEFKIVNEDNE